MRAPPLGVRKANCLLLVVPSALVWLPIAMLGIAFGIGIVAIISLRIGLYTIIELPIEERSTRWTYGIGIGLGASTLIWVAVGVGKSTMLLTAVPLLLASAFLLIELVLSARNASSSNA